MKFLRVCRRPVLAVCVGNEDTTVFRRPDQEKALGHQKCSRPLEPILFDEAQLAVLQRKKAKSAESIIYQQNLFSKAEETMFKVLTRSVARSGEEENG